jgi:hypothetical protein
MNPLNHFVSSEFQDINYITDTGILDKSISSEFGDALTNNSLLIQISHWLNMQNIDTSINHIVAKGTFRYKLERQPVTIEDLFLLTTHAGQIFTKWVNDCKDKSYHIDESFFLSFDQFKESLYPTVIEIENLF